MRLRCDYSVRVRSLWRRATLSIPLQAPVAAAVVLFTLAAAVAEILAAAPRTVLLLLTLAQSASVAWLVLRSIDPHRRWASAGIVLAGAWFLTFLVPSWIYVLEPALAAGWPAADAVAITTIALLSVICGTELIRIVASSSDDLWTRPLVESGTLSRRWIIGWIVFGSGALALLFGLNGGPVAWITNLDKVGAMTRGLTYVIGLALVVKHVAITVVAHRMHRLGRLDLTSIALIAGAVLFLLPLGARLFVALLLVETLLLHAILVRPISLRVLGPVATICALLLIFGYGTVKRYQTFTAVTPNLDQGFEHYVRERALNEVGAAYANNYADGVLLTAQVRSVVPRQVGYEHGEAFARLVLQPIPSPFRPTVERERLVERFLGSNAGNSHAVPLQAEGYVQFGLLGVIALFALVGAAVALLERGLSRRSLTLPALVVLVAATVQIPLIVRSGIPLGVAVAGLYVLGSYAVAHTVVRTSRGEHHGILGRRRRGLGVKRAVHASVARDGDAPA